MEYDYEFTGDPNGSWSSFWINSKKNGGWVKNAEIDTLEDMWGSLSHNFAGEGDQVHFKGSDRTRGHVTSLLTEYGAKVTDCSAGSKTCPEGGNWAHHNFDGSTIADIKNGSLTHHLDIDIWETGRPMSLKITNLKLKGGHRLTDNCHVLHGTSF